MSNQMSDEQMAALTEGSQTSEELQPGTPGAPTAASEAIIAKHLRDKENAAPGKKGPGFLSRVFSAVTALPRATLNHAKNNWAEIGFVTAAGAGAAYGIALAAHQPETAMMNNAFAMAALSYPTWGILKRAGGGLGYTLGHFANWRGGDRFNEIKAKARGEAAGMVTAAAVIAFGGVFGMDYVHGLKYAATNAPSIIGQDLPSGLIHTFAPHLNNTQWDPRWSLTDQPNCLYQEILQDKVGTLCVRGPGADKLELRVLP
ncbi:MAG: hypothetical protein KKA05_05250 [Alphaproteobacteria bacterium]|nr:hypothetical protein [Alphaproteobacteria bacterium]MBU0858616.1 hypothetical protein [Alphaproteobacteria bacterium]